MDRPDRQRWKSRLGFILTSAGAAVGLGNLQRFPYMTAHFGGAAFVVIYLLCVIFLATPLMLVEFAIGRHTQSNPVRAIAKIHPTGLWKWVGMLGILTAYFILTYYLVAASWTVNYVFEVINHRAPLLDEVAINPWNVIIGMVIFQLLVITIVQRGLKRGLEKCNKILMPLLFVMLLALIVRVLMLPGSWEGLVYYLKPNFSEVNHKAVLYALGQAFFSLCIGEAVLLTYGSYASKEDNLVSSALYIALFDTAVALLSGFVLFPAIFAFQVPPDQGVGLIYNIMPNLLLQLPFGNLIGAAFFLILVFAALTTSIALLEVAVSYTVDTFKGTRKTATWCLGSLAFLLAIPSALSKGISLPLTQLSLPFLEGTGLYEIMDFAWGGLGMVFGGLLLSIFVGWVWGTDQAIQEIRLGAPHFNTLGKSWAFIVKWFAPLAIVLVLVSLFL
ncbi:MAG: sodium-dependent transporter [Chlamydiia bacterium]|nr:sodium-dependent transporter [Chlamydiia bacterium]